MNRYLVLVVLAATALPAQAFVTYFVNNSWFKWDLQNMAYHANLVNPTSKAIRYQLATDAFSAANRDAELNAARACFDQWQAVPGTSLRFEEGPLAPAGMDIALDNTNLVYWVKNTTVVRGGRDNISGKRGYAFAWFFPSTAHVIREADIVLNGNQFNWFTDFNNTVNVAAFVESVLLHEIGHAIGFDHSPAGGATMANGAGGIGTQAGLSQDEISGVRYLYPAGLAYALLKGKVTMNGTGIYGAVVTLESQNGNVLNSTLTRPGGDYEIPLYGAGSYNVRVSPLDPLNSAQNLLRPDEIAPGYESTVTAFLATANRSLTINAQGEVTLNIPVTSGNQPFRITSLSIPSQIALISTTRNAQTMRRGSTHWYVAVNGPNLPANGVLTVTGQGITMGASVHKPNQFFGVNSIMAPITIAADAVPGLRSFVVTDGQNVAYANGYLEILPAFPDFNFDGLDDYFQRQYFPRWTAPASAPLADPDSDKFSNAYEERTGSNPTSAASYNFLLDRIQTTVTESIITFKSEPGKRYRILSRLAFTQASPWLQRAEVTATGINTEVRILHGRGTPVRQFFRLELLP